MISFDTVCRIPSALYVVFYPCDYTGNGTTFPEADTGASRLQSERTGIENKTITTLCNCVCNSLKLSASGRHGRMQLLLNFTIDLDLKRKQNFLSCCYRARKP